MRRHAKAPSAGSTHRRPMLALLLGSALLGTLVLGVTLAIATAPTVSVNNASGVTHKSAEVSGTVDPQDHETSYHFDYATQADFSDAVSGPTGGPLAEGSGSTPVGETLSGLTPSTTYHLRLIASNTDGDSEAVAASTFTTLAAPKPAIDREFTSAVGSSYANLNARIDPEGFETAYHFEWGTEDCSVNPCASIPVPDAGIGSEDVPDEGLGGPIPKNEKWHTEPLATQHLSGLTPDTTYHYRTVATSSSGTSTGADLTFHTSPLGSPFGLPDNRAYEMVSPVAKNGGDIAANPMRTQVSADGNSVAYKSLTPFSDVAGTGLSVEYVSHRSASGWETHGLTPNQVPDLYPIPNIFSGTQYVSDFPPDFSAGVIRGHAPLTDAPNVQNAVNLYLRTDPLFGDPDKAHYELLSDSVAPLTQPSDRPGSTFPRTTFADATPDNSQVIFESSNNLTQDAIDAGLEEVADGQGGSVKLYEWDDGVERLASVLPGGTASPGVAGRGAQEFAFDHYTRSTISDDGSKVFFEVPPLEHKDTGTLYMRAAHATTVQLNASEKTNGAGPGGTDPNGPKGAVFWVSTPDASKAFFTTTEELTNDDNDATSDLYMYDTTLPPGSDNLTLISTDSGAVISGLGVSEDASYVYFQASAGVVPGQPHSYLGEDYFYVWHNGSTRSIAGLNPETAAPNYLTFGESSPSTLDDLPTRTGSLFRMTPDGRSIAFQSNSPTADLTGYDNNCEFPSSQAPWYCSEVYLYGYESDELTCASCNPTGVPPDRPDGTSNFDPTGAAAFSFLDDGAGYGQASAIRGRTQHLTTPLSADGKHLFFTTSEALVPQDTNGRFDVYEYDTETGQRHLISTGQCDCNSTFVEASPDGRDAFFTTSQSLVRIDIDKNTDLYDARVNGGIPSQNALPPAQCEGDACQAPAQAPNDPTPASAGFNGPGNPPAKFKKRRHKKAHKHKQRNHKRHATHRNG